MADKGNIGRIISFPKPYTTYPNFALGSTKFGASLTRVKATITGGTPNMPVTISLNGFDLAMILKLDATGSLNIYDLADGTFYVTEQGSTTGTPKNIWTIVVSGAVVTVTRMSTSTPTSISF